MAISDFVKKHLKRAVKTAVGVLSPGANLVDKTIGYKKVSDYALKSAQGTARGYAGAAEGIQRLGAKVGEKLTGQKFEVQTLKPTGKVQEAIFGTDKPITSRSVGEEVPFVKKGGKAAPFVGAIMGSLDLIPGGKGLTTTLKSANKIDDVVRILKSGTKFADDVIQELAPTIARTTDEKVIKNLLDSAMRAGKKVDPIISEALTKESAVSKAFTSSKEQARIGRFEIGSFGRNALERKAGQPDRFAASELEETQKYITEAYRASDNPKNYRKDNVAWIAKMPNGETRVIYTRLNSKGAEEIINAHKISNPAFEETLKTYGVPAGSRTQIPSLERSAPSPLADGDKGIISKLGEGDNTLGGKERGFVTSAKQAIPEADKIAGQYIPRSTDDLAIKAKNLIADDFLAAEKMAMTGSDDNAVAVASELLKKYADDAAKATDPATANALYDKAAEVANTLAPKLTEQGRAIQAASILGRLTPEGQVRFAAREIQRYNDTLPIGKKRLEELSGEQAKEILDEMKVINEMADGTEKAMRFQKLQNLIQDLIPTPFMKKAIAVWKAGLLTGLKTQGLNIFSNLFHNATEVVKDVPAAVVDSVAALFTGQRTKTLTMRGAGSGLAEGFQKGLRYFKTGFDERNIGTKLDYHRVNFGKGVVAKAAQGYTDFVFRFLGAQDQPFYYGALSRSLMDQALAQGKNFGFKGNDLVKYAETVIESPTEEMIRYAVADATTAVFQNSTKLGEIAKGVQRLGGGAGEIVLPFGKTPSAVAMQIINYSPIGIAKTIIENVGKGKFDQRLFSQGIGRGLTGTAIIAIGVEMAKKGMISLDFPLGDEREQELQKAEGRKENSILINGKWRSPIIFGPAGNLLLIGAHFQNALDTSGSPTEAMSKAVFGGLKSFTEQTFLTGLKDAVNALTDPQRYAKSYLPNLLASAVPTIVSDVAKSTDPLERRAETTIERVQARIPGARNKLEPQVDIIGRERARVGNPMETFADPTRPSKDVSTPVTKELRRLTDAGFKVSPTALGDKKGFKALSQEENTHLWKLAGGITNDKLESLFGREEYQKLSDEKKGKVIEKIVDQAKVNARAGMVIELTDGLRGDDLKAKLSELKAGGLLTQEVLKKYLELR